MALLGFSARTQIKCIIMQISCRFDKTIKRNPTVLRPHLVKSERFQGAFPYTERIDFDQFRIKLFIRIYGY